MDTKSESKTDTSSSTNSTTSNADQRLSLAAGGVGGTASSGGTVNITNTDSGAFALVAQSVDTIAKTHAAGFDGLLDSYGKLLDTGKYIIDAGAKATAANAQLAHDALLAYAPSNSAATVMGGTKTLLYAAAIGAAVLILRK
jgi:hypothetical protein